MILITGIGMVGMVVSIIAAMVVDIIVGMVVGIIVGMGTRDIVGTVVGIMDITGIDTTIIPNPSSTAPTTLVTILMTLITIPMGINHTFTPI